MSLVFKRAVKEGAKLRLALAGPAGSGKTFTALTIAEFLASGSEPAVIDTENGSASKYADRFAFATLTLSAATGFAPEKFIEAIEAAEEAGFPVVVIDSLSHEWNGKGGVLELVDQVAARMNGNKFNAWGVVTPRHDKLVRKILEAKAHIIVTLRTKMDHVQEKNDRGRTEVRAVGLKPIQRDELEYEFDVFGMMDLDNNLSIWKSRCPELSGEVIHRPGRDMAQILARWLQGDTGERSGPGGPSGGRERPKVTKIKAQSVAPDPVAAAATLTGAPAHTMIDDMPEDDGETDDEDPPPHTLSMMDPEWRPEPEDEPGPEELPTTGTFPCSELECTFKIAPEDEYVFGGKRLKGAYILRRADEEAGVPLCPQHVAAWIKGDSLNMKPEAIAAAS